MRPDQQRSGAALVQRFELPGPHRRGDPGQWIGDAEIVQTVEQVAESEVAALEQMLAAASAAK